MNIGRPQFVFVARALAALTLVANLIGGEQRLTARAAEGDEVEYTFGRPVKPGEQTYDWYRKTHADEAAKRYGVDPKKVADGMDTWHWWCGVDNPQLWRKLTNLSGGKGYSAAPVRLDFFRLLFKTSRADVADFMINVVANRSTIRKVIGLSN